MYSNGNLHVILHSSSTLIMYVCNCIMQRVNGPSEECIQLLCGGATSWGLYPVIVWWGNFLGTVSSYCVVGQLPGDCIQLLCGGATSWGLYEVMVQGNYDSECLIM